MRIFFGKDKELLAKRFGILERLVACHLILQSHGTQDALKFKNARILYRGWYDAIFVLKHMDVRLGWSHVM